MPYIKATVSYTNSEDKKTKESYLVAAASTAEAEALLATELPSLIPFPYDIVSLQKTRIADCLRSEGGGQWWEALLECPSIDERTGKEKSLKERIALQAGDFHSASLGTERHIERSMADIRMLALRLTPVAELIEPRR